MLDFVKILSFNCISSKMFKLLFLTLLLGFVFGKVTYDAKTKTFVDSSSEYSICIFVYGDNFVVYCFNICQQKAEKRMMADIV